MKLLTLTVIKEFEKEVKRILLHAGVKEFTFMNVTGYRDTSAEGISNNWFASGINETESLLFWAFIPKENVDGVEKSVQHFNADLQSQSRIHLTVLQIERSI